ncbi:sensor histidine kinase [Nevskia soli]|uniref:sensor histidine kinase n=1 Tax=Nevskia soli TaxID=418856 RepID=UPI0006899D68|nr:histidine kinase [Nevskia soli]
MEQAPQTLRANHWSGPFAPLSLAVYLTWIAVALQPWLDWRHGRLHWSGVTAVGLLGMIAVPVLYILRSRYGRPESDADLARLRILVLLQIPAALLACYAFGGGTMPILLVVIAGQVSVLYPLRAALGLMLLANAALLLMLQQRWGWADAAASMLSYGAFQTFAAMMTAYARSAEESRDIAVRINSELLATRRLLLESTRSEERLRLSRELHDVVGHKLTALKLQLRLQARQGGQTSAPAIAECERLADELLTDVRGVVGALREHDGIDLQQALAALVPALPHPRVRLELAPEARAAGVAQAQALLRCAQEGLTNALRHSGAAQIVIRLAADAGGIGLSVEDDGRAQQAPIPGNGLRGMRERLEALGGRLELGVAERGGLRLRAWLPQASPADSLP